MLQDSEAAAKFIDTIINAKLNGVEIEPEVRKTLHKNLLERLENQLTYHIVSLLNEQEQLEVEHLVDSNQADRIEGYLTKRGININQVIANTMMEFQTSYLGI
jgi:hypothetical protein